MAPRKAAQHSSCRALLLRLPEPLLKLRRAEMNIENAEQEAQQHEQQQQEVWREAGSRPAVVWRKAVLAEASLLV